MAKKICRYGVLGVGRHAERVVINAFADTTSSELVALGTSSIEKQAILSERYSNIVVAESYQELIERDDIDAVFICLPNHLHAQWSIKALEAGKHVLCEKPLTMSFTEAQEVNAVAEACNRKLLEGFIYRFHPQHQEVKQLLATSRIGTVQLFEARFYYTLSDRENVRLIKEYGGGMLYDIGCYMIDCVRFLFDEEPTSVRGNWHIGVESEVDESAFFELTLPSGVTAHLSISCCMPRITKYTIYGSNGTIHAPSAIRMPRNKPGLIELRDEDGKLQIIKTEPVNQMALQIDTFSKWIAGEKIDLSLLGNGLQNMKIIDAARRAMSEEIVVTIV